MSLLSVAPVVLVSLVSLIGSMWGQSLDLLADREDSEGRLATASAIAPNSDLRLVSQSFQSDSITITWEGAAAPYQVQSSASLPAVWIPETVELIGQTASIPVDPTVSSRFYRVVSGVEVVPGNRITSPIPGSTLSAAKGLGIDFNWAVGGSEPNWWWFYVGTEADRDQYYNSGLISADRRSTTVTNLPFDGAPVLVTLFWKTGAGPWLSAAYDYPTATWANIVQPTPGVELASGGVFHLDPLGLDVEVWRIEMGSTLGGKEYYMNEQLDSGASVHEFAYEGAGIVSNGAPVYVRLWWKLTGQADFVLCRDYQYKASSGPVGPGPS